MFLKNITTHLILSEDLREAKSFLDQIFGLLKIPHPSALLIKTRFGIHTFGLQKLIDVVVLDKQNLPSGEGKNYKVVKLKSSLKPNSLFFWHPRYSLVIELPAGTLKKTETSLGCNLELKIV